MIPASLSPAALQLILDQEVGGGRQYYNRFLLRPDWPGESSGVTIGIGYDLGYNTPSQIRSDWADLPPDVRDRLAAWSGISGTSAQHGKAALHDITVNWDEASKVFLAITVPRWIRATCATFPGAENLPPDAFGSLVSVVFNRGTSLDGPRRREMRNIAQLCQMAPDTTVDATLTGIAAELRSMKRLWPDTRGLRDRREAEAVLVEKSVPASI
jgi:hypothetical protein